MDFESLKKYALSIHKMAQEGPDLYFCRPYIEGPAYSYPEITDVLLNFVFCELKSGWVFMTKAQISTFVVLILKVPHIRTPR